MMKNKLFQTLILILFCLIGCKKEAETATLTVKVFDVKNQLASGIFVDVLDNLVGLTPGYQKNKTSVNGELKFIVPITKRYQIYLVPAYEYNDLFLGNTDAQYVNMGTFKSQSEIDSSPIQNPTPKIGDIKYADINGDGVVNKLDLVLNVNVNADSEIVINLKSN